MFIWIRAMTHRWWAGLVTWFNNTFDPYADWKGPRDRVTDKQWANLQLKKARELVAIRADQNKQETVRFQRSRDWTRVITQGELNAKKRWR